MASVRQFSTISRLKQRFATSTSPSISASRSRFATPPVQKKINRLLVANRGEIALRVMRTARRMGVETVGVYSEVDRGCMHVAEADQARCIGAVRSYLDMDQIIDVAHATKAQAIHPGYGFLSENAEFADKCAKAGLVFIGPPARSMADMGAKDVAKRLMKESGVPVIEGYHGEDQSDETLRLEASKIGYPVMIKAVYGGGGKGMRIAQSEAEFNEKLSSARSEASKAFGNAAMLVEKFIERPRHVEVQIFGDHLGNYVYLWERDCSVQRRHQKIIEEAPAPGISDVTRKQLGECAVQASKAAGYVGAGTVEFIIGTRNTGGVSEATKFYFMEMNTRLQVEHPISEAITGLDFVEWQIRVAEGEKLPLKQEQIELNGHAIETRICAEDTDSGFMPAAGTLNYLSFPSWTRVDAGIKQGDKVSIYYDPMIAKVVVWGPTRDKAISKMLRALRDTHIVGLPTNVSFASSVLRHPAFQEGDVCTDFIAENKDELFKSEHPSHDALCDAVIAAYLLSCAPFENKNDPFMFNDCFRINHSAEKEITLDGKTYKIRILSKDLFNIQIGEECYTCQIDDAKTNNSELVFTVTVDSQRRKRKAVFFDGKMTVFGENRHEYTLPVAQWLSEGATAASSDACAPMPGVVEKVLVTKGDKVKQDQPLIIMVAMKMEYIIRAPHDAVVESVLCSVGESVQKSAHLVKFESN